jgi:RNA polymerase sigma-70 factor (sigma-E family)
MSDFDSYVAERGAALLRVAYLLTGDRHLAEDLVQDVLATAYLRWGRVSSADSRDAYVRTMLVRRHLSWRRRRSSGEMAAPGTDTVVGRDFAADYDAHDAAWRLLATLPRRQRAVLVLRYYEDLTDEAIAALLGCGASTVRSNAARGLATLRARERVTDHATERATDHATERVTDRAAAQVTDEERLP